MGNDKDIKFHLKKFQKKIKTFNFFENEKVTTRKRRFVDEMLIIGKLNEVYFMDDNFLGQQNKKIINYLK